MLTSTEKKQLNRIRTILLFVMGRALTAGPLEDTFYLEPHYFASRSPLLQDEENLLKAFKRITKETNRNIVLEPQELEVADADGKGVSRTETAIYLHIEDEKEAQVYMDKIDEELGIKKNESAKQEIRTLHLVKNDVGDRIIVIINGQFLEDEIQPRITGPRSMRWSKLFEVAEYGVASTDSKQDARSIVDYFNTRKECPLYSTYDKYKRTKVLRAEGDELSKVIEIELLSQKTYVTRRNKQNT